jgi:hypothetical protein
MRTRSRYRRRWCTPCARWRSRRAFSFSGRSHSGHGRPRNWRISSGSAPPEPRRTSPSSLARGSFAVGGTAGYYVLYELDLEGFSGVVAAVGAYVHSGRGTKDAGAADVSAAGV